MAYKRISKRKVKKYVKELENHLEKLEQELKENNYEGYELENSYELEAELRGKISACYYILKEC